MCPASATLRKTKPLLVGPLVEPPSAGLQSNVLMHAASLANDARLIEDEDKYVAKCSINTDPKIV